MGLKEQMATAASEAKGRAPQEAAKAARRIVAMMRPLGHLLPLAEMERKAHAEAQECSGRNDVPAGPQVTPDLRDEMGDFTRLPNGRAVSGRVLRSDLVFGSDSASAPLMASMAVPVLALASMLNGLMGSSISPFAPGALGVSVMAAWLLFSWLVVGEGAGTAFLALCAFAASPMVSQVSGWAPLALWLFVAAAPFIHSRAKTRERAQKLFQAGTDESWRTGKGVDQAREEQAAAAAKDPSPFLFLGRATGRLSMEQQDRFAPDAGLPIGMSADDLSTHLIVFGKSGTGKTQGVLKPVGFQWMSSGAGGSLVLDGKGALAGEIAETMQKEGVPFLLVQPGLCQVGLIEGLSPVEIKMAVTDAQSGDSAKGGQGESAYFTGMGGALLYNAAVVLEALVFIESLPKRIAKRVADGSGVDAGPFYRWTLQDIENTVDGLCRHDLATGYADWIRFHLPNASSTKASTPASGRAVLDEALAFIDKGGASPDPEAAANILAVVHSWLWPLKEHEDLLSWYQCEGGADVSSCLRGAHVGVNVPEDVYGRAGRLVTSLLKNRVFNGIKRRADKPEWRKEGETPVLFLVDEAQDVLGESDKGLIPKARSLGMRGVYATQSYESYSQSMGEDATEALLNNFASFVLYDSSPRTVAWARAKMGQGKIVSFFTKSAPTHLPTELAIAFDGPLFDASHPLRDQMKKILRKGIFSKIKGSMPSFGGARIDKAAHLGDTQIVDILSPEIASALTSQRGIAIMQLSRSGSPRRDVVQVIPMHEWSAGIHSRWAATHKAAFLVARALSERAAVEKSLAEASAFLRGPLDSRSLEERALIAVALDAAASRGAKTQEDTALWLGLRLSSLGKTALLAKGGLFEPYDARLRRLTELSATGDYQSLRIDLAQSSAAVDRACVEARAQISTAMQPLALRRSESVEVQAAASAGTLIEGFAKLAKASAPPGLFSASK